MPSLSRRSFFVRTALATGAAAAASLLSHAQNANPAPSAPPPGGTQSPGARVDGRFYPATSAPPGDTPRTKES